MAELVDALASGASGSKIPWRFESSSGHTIEANNGTIGDHADVAELVYAQS